MGVLFLIVLLLDIVQILVGSAVVMTIWNWYVPMAFESMPTLTLGMAFGLSCVTSSFTLSVDPDYEKRELEDVMQASLQMVFTKFFKQIFLLAVAAIGYMIITSP